MNSLARLHASRIVIAVAVLLIAGSLCAARERTLPAGRLREARPEIMSGRFTGVGVPLFVDRQTVSSWLPPGLQPAPECPYEQHPVIILFGTQRDLAVTRSRTYRLWYTRNGRCFRETFIAVPYLHLTQRPYREPVLHFVRVYLDHPRAKNQGERRFGWPKVLAAITSEGPRYRIDHPTWGTIFEAETDDARLRPLAPGDRSFGSVRDMLSQPLVLRFHGAFDLYEFDFHFDEAAIGAVPAEVELHHGFMPRLEPIRAAVGGIDQSDFGAFFLDCRFTKVAAD